MSNGHSRRREARARKDAARERRGRQPKKLVAAADLERIARQARGDQPPRQTRAS